MVANISQNASLIIFVVFWLRQMVLLIRVCLN